MQIRHLPPLLRFLPQFAQICIIFAQSKFEANPFFRPVPEIATVQDFLERRQKRRYISLRINVRALLEKQDRKGMLPSI